MTIRATPTGRLGGLDVEGGAAFLGIPYAEPPVGTHRWQAPQPVRPWSGVRRATALPAAPPQPAGGTPGSARLPGLEVGRTDEDCLALNVWVPRRATNVPVMVWLPGGAFVTGGAAIPLFDGAGLAFSRRVIVVTVTYRVGALGFAAVPGCPPNRGLLDQVEALRWIQANVAAFGGDPDNVTVFGESAGGGSLLHLLAMPSSRGLLRRAIVQSGATDHTLDEVESAATASRFVEALGHDLAAPTNVVLQAQAQVLAAGADVGPMPFHPFVDGSVLPARPVTALATTDVDLLIGTTRDEMRLYLDPAAPRLDRERLIKRTARYLASLGAPEGEAGSLIQLYAVDSRLGTAGDVWSAIYTDGEMRRPADAMAAAHAGGTAATFAYRFDQPLVGTLADLWSCHASDLPYPFGTLDCCGWPGVLGPGAHRLSAGMQDAWAAFAEGGDPSCDAVGDWPRFDTTRRATMLLSSAGCRVEHDPDGARRRRWAELAPVT